MDYTLILNEISNNQVLILDTLKSLKDGVYLFTFILVITFLYFFIRNVTKTR